MRKKLLWAVVALLALTMTVLIAAWPRYLPVASMHGDPPPRESFEEMVNRAELIVLADVKTVKQGPDFVSPISPGSVYRVPTQRVTLEAVKVYKGEVAPGQMLTLYQDGVGVTWFGIVQFFMINENDPVYEPGERYALMLGPVSIPEELKPFQPEPWQEGMFSVVYPEGRMRLNTDGTVMSMADPVRSGVAQSINGKALGEIEALIANATTTPTVLPIITPPI